MTRTVLSLFSGAGGMDIGLSRAGWQILAQLEMEPDCVGTLRNEANRTRSGCLVINKPIEDVSPRELRRRLGLKNGELDLLAGGPPCQPFTTTGLRQSINDARVNSLFPSYLDFVSEFSPKSILIENVDGMLSAAIRHRPLKLRGNGHRPISNDEKKGSFLKWLLGELDSRGYSVSWGVAEAADYGVPQLRQRAILIGIKGNAPCFLPQPKYGWPGLPEYRTLRDAIGRIKNIGAVQPLSERKKEVYRQIPPGGNWRNLPDKTRRSTMGAAYFAEGGRGGWWRRLDWDSPAPTILGMPDHSSTALVHPDEVRCLSVRECAAVQNFPGKVRFAGSSRSQYQQIGNAVPSKMAQEIGTHIDKFLDGARQPRPPEPAWRRRSANRRIGTHGWTVHSAGKPKYFMNAKVRPDHIWANAQECFTLG